MGRITQTPVASHQQSGHRILARARNARAPRRWSSDLAGEHSPSRGML